MSSNGLVMTYTSNPCMEMLRRGNNFYLPYEYSYCKWISLRNCIGMVFCKCSFLPISVSICPSICLSVCLSICLFVYLSVYLHTSMSLSISLHVLDDLLLSA